MRGAAEGSLCSKGFTEKVLEFGLEFTLEATEARIWKAGMSLLGSSK